MNRENLIEVMAKTVIIEELKKIAQPARWLGTFPRQCLTPIEEVAADQQAAMVALRGVLDACAALHDAINVLAGIPPEAPKTEPLCGCDGCVARRKAAS